MHDLIIIGTGPAGLTASIYASRYKIKHLLLGAEPGGYLNEIHKIENYPGIPSITGFELAKKIKDHAESLDGKIAQEIVENIKKEKEGFQVETNQSGYQAKNIIYAIGTKEKRLGITGEKEFKGRGVSYCATCDGPFFKDKEVVVIGGGNSAAMAALMLSEHSKRVAVVFRKPEMGCAPAYLEKINNNEKIEKVKETNVVKIKGNGKVEKVIFDNPYNDSKELKTDGVFIEIGSVPVSELAEETGVELNEQRYIKTNPDQSTNLEGFFAAGDITTNSNGFQQIITACSEGAIAALGVYEKLKKLKS